MAKNRTYLTLSQAAKQTGKSKSVLSKALKNGTLSYASKDSSGYKIDAAELFRVFSPQELENGPRTRSRHNENGHENTLENALKIKELEVENKLLHERMKDKEERINELQEERNQWRNQAQTLLLTHKTARKETEMAQENTNSNEAGQGAYPVKKRLREQLWTIGIIIVVLIAMSMWGFYPVQ